MHHASMDRLSVVPAVPNGSQWTPQTPEEVVLQAFLRIGRRMKSKQAGEAVDHSAIAALHALRCTGAIRLSELAALIGLDASTASRLVRTLEIAGLLDRAPDPDDRRAFRVVLTPAGVERLAEFSRQRREMFGRAMRGWQQSEMATFATLISRFADGVNETAHQRDDGRRTHDKENR